MYTCKCSHAKQIKAVVCQTLSMQVLIDLKVRSATLQGRMCL